MSCAAASEGRVLKALLGAARETEHRDRGRAIPFNLRGRAAAAANPPNLSIKKRDVRTGVGNSRNVACSCCCLKQLRNFRKVVGLL